MEAVLSPFWSKVIYLFLPFEFIQNFILEVIAGNLELALSDIAGFGDDNTIPSDFSELYTALSNNPDIPKVKYPLPFSN